MAASSVGITSISSPQRALLWLSFVFAPLVISRLRACLLPAIEDCHFLFYANSPPPPPITTDAFAPTYRFKSTQYVKFDSPEERGCHWDNTRRNKVMFRGKHSLGIVLYLCSLTDFLFFLFLFPLFRHISSFSLHCVSVFCVLDDSISLLCSLFPFVSPVVIFIHESKLKVSRLL